MGREAVTPDCTGLDCASTSEADSRRRSGWHSLVRGLVAIAVFLGAIRLLGEVSGAASDELAGVLSALHDHPLSALGLGWLFTYVLTNGSVVAALGVTVAGVGPGDPTLTVSLVSGSRLGAAAFVVMVGVLDHLRSQQSLRSGVELGVLAFIVSHVVYIPATLLSWASISFLVPPLANLTSRIDPAILQPGVADAAARGLIEAVGPVLAAGIGLGGLFTGVVLFDRALRGVDLDRIRERIPLDRRWVSFLGGLIVTAVTSSIAFSIGVLVPLFNRKGITRKEIVPYILGANVTTLIDTYFVSLVLGSWDAGGAVLGLMLVSLFLSVLFLVAYGPSFRILDRLLDAVTGTQTGFVLFVVSLFAAPMFLVVVGAWL